MPCWSQRSEIGVCSRRWSRRMATFSWAVKRFRVFLDMGVPPLEVVAYSSRRFVPFQLKQDTVLIYTAARVGAVAKLKLKQFEHDGSHWSLRFDEKGGKSREIPVRHDLEEFLLAYRNAAGLTEEPKDSPLFRSAVFSRTRALTKNRMSAIDMCRMVKRRLKDADLPLRLSPHSFRVTTITDLLEHGSEINEVQYLAGHADARTTELYDRRKKKVTRNIVERISI